MVSHFLHLEKVQVQKPPVTNRAAESYKSSNSLELNEAMSKIDAIRKPPSKHLRGDRECPRTFCVVGFKDI